MRTLLVIAFLFLSNIGQSQSTADLFSIDGLKFAAPHHSILTVNFQIYPSGFFYVDKLDLCEEELLRYRRTQSPDQVIYLKIDGGKVYYGAGDNPCENAILMFNFELEIGESFTNGFNKFEGFTVTQRDSVALENEEKRLRLILKKDNYQMTWIEGLGDTRFGIDLLSVVGVETTGYGLSCVLENDELLYKGSVYSSELCEEALCVTSFADFNVQTNQLQSEFENSSLYASDNVWDFGDGNSSTEINPIHEYDEPGCYDVKLTTSDSCTMYIREAELVNNVCLDNAWKRNASTQYLNFYKIQEFNGVFYAVNDKLHRSDDNLETFDEVEIPMPAQGRRRVIDVKMFDNQRGVLICTNSGTGSDRSALFYTENGGVTWIDPITDSYWMTTLDILPDGRAIAYGFLGYYYSNDFGVSWTEIEIASNWTFRRDLRFNDDNTFIGSGYINGFSSGNFYIFKSKDLGLTWDTIPVPDEVVDSYFVNDDLGFGYTPYDKELRKTEDGGLTWKLIEQSIEVSEMHFLESGVGVVNTRNGKSLYTENYMEDYSIVQCQENPILSITGKSIDNLWALKDSRIVQYKPEPLIDCMKTSISSPTPDSAIKIFPNPSSGNIKITGAEMTSIIIVNSIGEKIKSLYQAANESQLNLDVSNYEPGIYFITILQKNGKISTNKLIKF